MVESGEEIVFLDYGQEIVEGLAVNWVDKSVLYTNAAAGMIREVDIETRSNTELVTALRRPRGLVFFADSDKK